MVLDRNNPFSALIIKLVGAGLVSAPTNYTLLFSSRNPILLQFLDS